MSFLTVAIPTHNRAAVLRHTLEALTRVVASRGDYIVLTDDDTTPASLRLSAYTAAFARFPQVDVFGGPIEPKFIASPPAWLVDVMPEVASAYGRLESRGRGDILNAGLYPFGANMA
ncbi:MAG: glycosyltransferase family A protein [Gemmatimonadaceae bacterium]